MAKYQIAYHLATKTVTVQNLGDGLPAGANKIGEFEHADVETSLKDLEFDVNHVLFHHVRDALYHTNSRTGLAVPDALQFPDNITDMAGITVLFDAEFIPLTGIALTPAGPATLTVAAPTVQLAVTPTPANATNKTVTYVSSDPTKATVSATGLVTRVANGETTITATSLAGDVTATKVITVTA